MTLFKLFLYFYISCALGVCLCVLGSGRHQLSVCQLTSARFSCFLCVYVCVVACAITTIRLDRPENDISAITLMVTAQYCMSSAKIVCVVFVRFLP